VLAQNAGVPIVPVVIKGSLAVMPKTNMRIRSGDIHLEILPEISTPAFANQNKQDLMEAVRTKLTAALHPSEGA
jgi:1-acyl-sn-glycerol-3-phosphate acyltransferase